MRRGLYRLNSTVLSCRLNALNCISSRRSAGEQGHVPRALAEGAPKRGMVIFDDKIMFKNSVRYVEGGMSVNRQIMCVEQCTF